MSHTSFQRVFTALEHKEPDRVPIDVGGTAVTGINIHALRKLKDHMDIPGEVQLAAAFEYGCQHLVGHGGPPTS